MADGGMAEVAVTAIRWPTVGLLLVYC